MRGICWGDLLTICDDYTVLAMAVFRVIIYNIMWYINAHTVIFFLCIYYVGWSHTVHNGETLHVISIPNVCDKYRLCVEYILNRLT